MAEFSSKVSPGALLARRVILINSLGETMVMHGTIRGKSGSGIRERNGSQSRHSETSNPFPY